MNVPSMWLPRVSVLRASRAHAFLWPGLVCAVAAASAAPFWASQVLPFQDAPVHVASVQILANYHAAGMGFDHWFVVDLGRSQYLGFYLPAAALAKFMGADAACRTMLTVSTLAMPAAAWMLLRAFGRDRRLALFAPALVHSFPLYMGFFNFVESVPAAIAVVALTERQLRDPRSARALLLAFAAVVLLWLHPTSLAFAMGAAAVLALTSGRPRRHALLPYLPALGLFCFWAAGAIAGRDGGGAAHTSPRWLPFSQRLRDLLHFGDVLRTGADEMFVCWMLGLFLAIAVLAGVPWRRGGWRVPLLAVICVAGYFAAPFDLGYMGWIAHRALPFAGMLALAVPGISHRRFTAGLIAGAAVVQLAYFAKLSTAYQAFDEEAGVAGLQRVLEEARPGRRLLAQIWDQESEIFQYRPYMHFGDYYEILRGGRSVYNFAETPWPPIRFRPGTEPPRMPIGWEWQPRALDLPALSRGEDYLLIRGPAPEPPPQFTPIAQDGRWSLYESR